MTDCPPQPWFRRVLSALASLCSWFVIMIGTAWAFGALWFDAPSLLKPHALAIAFAVSCLLAALMIRPRWRAKLGITAAIIGIMSWWFSLQPLQHRDWKPDLSELATADINGDLVTIHNVRNCDYRTETDFTVHYECRQFDLRNLKGVDLFLTYWGSPYMAHPIMSFDFGPDGHICFSIETRSEKGEGYSALGGLYRQFELIYVVADERDVIRLRTNYRHGEDVYLYHLQAPQAKQSFMEYIRTINELDQSPRWYNAITNNCTTAIRHQRAADQRRPFDWRMLVNGYGDQMLYEQRAIDQSLPFAELKKISHINLNAKEADQSLDFSSKIRNGLPGMN